MVNFTTNFFCIIFGGLLPYQLVIRHAVLLHQLLDAVDVLLRNAAADVYADVVILADGDILQTVANVLNL